MQGQPIVPTRVNLPEPAAAVATRDAHGVVVVLVRLDSPDAVARWASRLALARMGDGAYALVLSSEVPSLASDTAN